MVCESAVSVNCCTRAFPNKLPKSLNVYLSGVLEGNYGIKLLPLNKCHLINLR